MGAGGGEGKMGNHPRDPLRSLDLALIQATVCDVGDARLDQVPQKGRGRKIPDTAQAVLFKLRRQEVHALCPLDLFLLQDRSGHEIARRICKKQGRPMHLFKVSHDSVHVRKRL